MSLEDSRWGRLQIREITQSDISIIGEEHFLISRAFSGNRFCYITSCVFESYNGGSIKLLGDFEKNNAETTCSARLELLKI